MPSCRHAVDDTHKKRTVPRCVVHRPILPVSRLTSAGGRSCVCTGPSPPPSRRARSSAPPPLPLHPSHFCWPQLLSTAGLPDTAQEKGKKKEKGNADHHWQHPQQTPLNLKYHLCPEKKRKWWFQPVNRIAAHSHVICQMVAWPWWSRLYSRAHFCVKPTERITWILYEHTEWEINWGSKHNEDTWNPSNISMGWLAMAKARNALFFFFSINRDFLGSLSESFLNCFKLKRQKLGCL